MFKHTPAINRIISISFLFTFSIILVYCSPEQPENESGTNRTAQQAGTEVPELADEMSTLQQYSHKYALAVEAENQELAQFYFHEVLATIEVIKDEIPSYDGYDIRRFMTLFIDPAIEPVEEAMKTRDWGDIREKTITLVNACNSCHNATNHGFIKVTPGFNNNPFNQDFSSGE